jgi:hypothetical protein
MEFETIFAHRFLTLLDEEADTFTFQTFDDTEAKRRELAKKVHHELTEPLVEKLVELSEQGAGIFVTINKTDGKGRTADNIIKVRAVFADDDVPRPGPRQDWPLEPHIVVESSPVKFHYYWLVDDLPKKEFEPIQHTIAVTYGTDPSVKDLPRVMRLPGFPHRKGEPFMTRIVSESSQRPYTANEIRAAFPPIVQPNLKKSENNGEKISEGSRNTYLVHIAGYLQRKGLRPETILAALEKENELSCTLPLPVSEVRQIATSIARYDAADPISLNKSVIAKSLNEFMRQDFPPPRMLLKPWLPAQGIVLVYALRGLGKTLWILTVVQALITQSTFLGIWEVSEPCNVLYVDGELPGAVLQNRLAGIMHNKPSPTGKLQIITPDIQPDGGCMPDLSTVAGQNEIEPYLDGVQVLILDSISTLTHSGKENEAESWIPVQQWALRLRRQGITTIFIHHAGKSGQQRGTSKREDVLDTTIALKRPADYSPDQGCRFELHFDKARHFFGQDAEPLEFQLESQDHPDIPGAYIYDWTVATVTRQTHQRVVELARAGLTQADIARELGLAKSTVHYHVKAAREDGELSDETITDGRKKSND